MSTTPVPKPDGPPPFITSTTLSGLIRAVRRRADLSQRELAKAIGVSRSTIAKYETGEIHPSLATLLAILDKAELAIVAVDHEGKVVTPMRVWDDTRDGGNKMFPAHLDLILDPRGDDWWGTEYGLASPPETYHRSRSRRDAERKYSQWVTRVKLYRYDPMPPNPNRRPRD